MRILGIIPARGGSKGIPRKNLAPLCGKPLIQWTIEAAHRAPSLSHLCVTTDDLAIADVCFDNNVEAIIRPAALARDYSPMIGVAQHALSVSEGRHRQRFDAVCLLQPTCPLRTCEDIEAAVETLGLEHQSCVSVVDVGEKHPRRMYWDSNGRLVSWSDGDEFARRQDLPVAYLRDGSIYLTRVESIRAGKMLSQHPVFVVTPPERYCNIDTPTDLIIAEALLNAHSVQRKESPVHVA